MRDLHLALRPKPGVNFWRGPRALAPEDEPIPFLELSVPQPPCRFRRKEPKALRSTRGSQKSLPMIVVADIELVPVVHASSTQLRIIDLKAERVDEVQDAARDCAHPTNVARVRRDLRAEENKVERWRHFRRLIAREISRFASRSLISCRLSCIFFPLPTASRHFARPCLK